MLQRSDQVVDVLFADEECVVLTADRCLRLAAVPSAAIAYLVGPRSVPELRVHLEEHFGPAPEGNLEAMVDELIATRILRRLDATSPDGA